MPHASSSIWIEGQINRQLRQLRHGEPPFRLSCAWRATSLEELDALLYACGRVLLLGEVQGSLAVSTTSGGVEPHFPKPSDLRSFAAAARGVGRRVGAARGGRARGIGCAQPQPRTHALLLLTAAALRPSPSPPADAAVTLFITVVSAPAPSSFRTMDGWPKAAANMSGVIAPLSGVSLSCKVAQHALSTGRWRELSTGPGARLAR